MPFVNIPGVTGMVYVPDNDKKEPKKHNCPDCISCAWCSDSRCSVCLRKNKKKCCKKKQRSKK